MSANDLADRLTYWSTTPYTGPNVARDMRAAAVLLRRQAEQLDTLRNERVEAVKAWEQMKAPLGAAEPFMRLDRIMRDWAAAGGGVPETKENNDG